MFQRIELRSSNLTTHRFVISGMLAGVMMG